MDNTHKGAAHQRAWLPLLVCLLTALMVHGRTLAHYPGGGSRAILDLGGFAPGAYLITLQTNDGAVRTQRFIVGHQ